MKKNNHIKIDYSNIIQMIVKSHAYSQVILAEDNEIRDKLAEHDLHVQTIAEAAPIEVSYHAL